MSTFFNAALGFLSMPFQSCVRTDSLAHGACCVNTTATGASIASIAAGVIFSNPAAIAVGAVVCPIAAVNMCIARDYSVIQSEVRGLKSDNKTLKDLQDAARAISGVADSAREAGASVAVAVSDVALEVKTEDAEVLALKAEVQRLTSGETTLQLELAQVRSELASISQSKDEITHEAEELHTENATLKMTAEKIRVEFETLNGASQAKEAYVEKLGQAVARFQQEVGQMQSLTQKLDQLMVIERALKHFKAEDVEGYNALVQKFPGLALPV